MSQIQNTNKKSCYQFTVNATGQQINQVIQSFLAANRFKLINKNDYQYYCNDNIISGKNFFEYEIEGKRVVIYAYLGSVKKPVMLDRSYKAALNKAEYRKILDPLLMYLQKMSAPQPVYSQQTNMQQQAVYNQQAGMQQQAVYNQQVGMQQQAVYNQQAGMQQQAVYNQQAGMQQQLVYNQQAGMQQQPVYNQQAGTQQQPVYNQQAVAPHQQAGNTYGDTYSYFKKQENDSNGKLAIIAFVMAIIQVIISFSGFYYGGILIVLEIYYAVKGLKSDKMPLSIATFVLLAISVYEIMQWVNL